jgi:hypothetical protein
LVGANNINGKPEAAESGIELIDNVHILDSWVQIAGGVKGWTQYR